MNIQEELHPLPPLQKKEKKKGIRHHMTRSKTNWYI